MRTVLYRNMMVFALLVSCNAFGDVEQPDCRSWWSGPDGVHHCLLSGNGEDKDTQTPATKEANNGQGHPEELLPDDDSPRNQLPDPTLEDISAPKEFEPRMLPNFRKENPS